MGRPGRPGQQGWAGQGFSPIFLLHLQHLLPEKVLSYSLHIIEAVSQELEQRPPLPLTALRVHCLAQATDAAGTPVPYRGH